MSGGRPCPGPSTWSPPAARPRRSACGQRLRARARFERCRVRVARRRAKIGARLLAWRKFVANWSPESPRRALVACRGMRGLMATRVSRPCARAAEPAERQGEAARGRGRPTCQPAFMARLLITLMSAVWVWEPAPLRARGGSLAVCAYAHAAEATARGAAEPAQWAGRGGAVAGSGSSPPPGAAKARRLEWLGAAYLRARGSSLRLSRAAHTRRRPAFGQDVVAPPVRTAAKVAGFPGPQGRDHPSSPSE